MSNIPTPQDAALFAQSVKKWQKILNLGDWRIEKGLKIYQKNSNFSLAQYVLILTMRDLV